MVAHFDLQDQTLCEHTLVQDRDRGLDDSAFVVHVRCRQLDLVIDDVCERGDHQVDIAIDAQTGVPPGVLMGPRLDADDILYAVAQMRVEAYPEDAVPVSPLPRELVVHIDHRVAVHALELESHPLLAPVVRHVKPLHVLHLAAGKEGGSRASDRFGRAREADHRVVWERDGFPLSAAEEVNEPAYLAAHFPVRSEQCLRHEWSNRTMRLGRLIGNRAWAGPNLLVARAANAPFAQTIAPPTCGAE